MIYLCVALCGSSILYLYKVAQFKHLQSKLNNLSISLELETLAKSRVEKCLSDAKSRAENYLKQASEWETKYKELKKHHDNVTSNKWGMKADMK